MQVTVFLSPPMFGCASKTHYHMNRGRCMDSRTPAGERRFVA